MSIPSFLPFKAEGSHSLTHGLTVSCISGRIRLATAEGRRCETLPSRTSKSVLRKLLEVTHLSQRFEKFSHASRRNSRTHFGETARDENRSCYSEPSRQPYLFPMA